MLSGYSPFYDTSSMEIYKRIINGYFECPDAIEDPAKNLIGKLLEKDITRRYGCQFGGAEDIKSHEWFGCVNWGIVKKKRIQPPWVPEVLNQNDE